MTSEHYDIVIIGAGVIGLSVGLALLDSRPSLKVLILDKESRIGLHASGRNSGVLHAGFYYSPDSLKARFCRDGNFELKVLCNEGDIPVIRCGKVVVTRDNEEESRLEALFQRGIANGVDLEIHNASFLKNYEPLANTYQRFLWSPNTAISDSARVIKYMHEKFLKMGGKTIFEAPVNLAFHSGEVVLESNKYRFKHLVNCAGAHSDRLAKKIGLSRDYAMIPFMGVYRATSATNLPLRTLVYPVPHQINPFLGVHFTLTLDGKVKIGPTAIPILGREQYSFFQGWSGFDFWQALKSGRSLIFGEQHDFSEILKSEWPKILKKEIVKEAAALVPLARNISNWIRKPPGIRAQLIHLPTGKLEQDFVIKTFNNTTHVLNAVSPGWTSSLPFGRYVANEFVLPSLS